MSGVRTGVHGTRSECESEFVTNCTGRHGHTVHPIHPPWVGGGCEPAAA